VAVGGMSNLWGVAFAGILLNFLSLRGYFGSYDDAVFGLILIIVMLFAPQGILHISRITGLFRGIPQIFKGKRIRERRST
jgi:branched-chain amino acid transport system permease protein